MPKRNIQQKNKPNLFSLRHICALFFVFVAMPAFSQKVTISGVVKDVQTEEPIEFASIVFLNSSLGGLSRIDGRFSVENNQNLKSIKVSMIGYNDTVIHFTDNKIENIEISLSQKEILLKTAVVTSNKRVNYSKKNNPAIDFMKEVIARKNENRIETKEYYQVERYEKFTTSLDNFDSTGKFFQKFGFLKTYIDSSEVNGKPILTLSQKETLEDVYYQKQFNTKKEILRAKRSEGIGKDMDESVDHNISELFQGINLYDNSIKLFQLYFISPLSSTMALTFYKYYILDTIAIDGIPCLNMAFFPYNNQSNGFTGNLYISLDNYSLKKAELKVPEKINLNFARNLSFTQSFQQLPDSTWVVSEENLFVNLYLFKNMPEVLVNQYRSYRDYSFEAWNNADLETKAYQNEAIINKSDTFWLAHRHVPIKQKEVAIKKMFAQLRELALYKTIVRATDFFASGYFLTGGNKEKSMFDIGPLLSMYSYNKVEGSRFMLGGMTTANLSKHFFLSGYAAYGIRDNKFKYNGKFTYSVNKKKYHTNEFPRNNISVLYEYDIYTPGVNYQEDKNFVLFSWKTGAPMTKMSYIRTMALEYEKDWNRHFNTQIWLKNQVDKPTGSLVYSTYSSEGVINNIPSLTTSELGVKLRYVIGKVPYNGRDPKMNFSKDATEFVLTHRAGIRNFLGGDYHYEHTEFSVKKRINLAIMGYLDGKVSFGKVWTKVPFPLLIIPNANQSITIQPDAFHTMQALEFVVDQYIGLNLTYHLNGLVFNRIPYVNLLKLRGIVSFNGMIGSLSDKNNPQKSSGVFLFPEGTKPLGKVPYIEMSFGIENIFKILRIDYFRRLTYVKETKWKGGVRFTFEFKF